MCRKRVARRYSRTNSCTPSGDNNNHHPIHTWRRRSPMTSCDLAPFAWNGQYFRYWNSRLIEFFFEIWKVEFPLTYHRAIHRYLSNMRSLFHWTTTLLTYWLLFCHRRIHHNWQHMPNSVQPTDLRQFYGMGRAAVRIAPHSFGPNMRARNSNSIFSE